jgi:Putative papain-like cysteine peptidase (DUF1796)
MSPAGVKFRHAISIGSSCLTANLLRRSNLRRYACPFDWAFSNPNLVLSCIRDDFKEYLDKDNLINDGSPTAWGHHTYRHRYGLQRTLNHHDVREQVDYERLRRAAIRFQALRHLEDRVMLVLDLPVEALASSHVRDELQEIAARFKNAKVVGIGWTPTGARKLERLSETEKIDVYSFTPGAESVAATGLEAEADNTLLDNVMTNYEFDLDGNFFGM